MVKHLYRCETCEAEADADAPGFVSKTPDCPNSTVDTQHVMSRAWSIAGAYVKW